MHLISLFLTIILTENVILTKFLGMCPFVGVSNKEKKAFGMGISVMLVVLISSILTYLVYHLILVPTHTEYLQVIMFILIIATCVQILELVLKKKFPKLGKSLGIYLPLITTNCAVLGIVLLNISNSYTFLEMLTFSIGSSLGFTLVLYVFSTVRERLENDNVPASFRGFPIAFITASIMAMLFARYIAG